MTRSQPCCWFVDEPGDAAMRRATAHMRKTFSHAVRKGVQSEKDIYDTLRGEGLWNDWHERRKAKLDAAINAPVNETKTQAEHDDLRFERDELLRDVRPRMVGCADQIALRAFYDMLLFECCSDQNCRRTFRTLKDVERQRDEDATQSAELTLWGYVKDRVPTIEIAFTSDRRPTTMAPGPHTLPPVIRPSEPITKKRKRGN